MDHLNLEMSCDCGCVSLLAVQIRRLLASNGSHRELASQIILTDIYASLKSKDFVIADSFDHPHNCD